MDINQRFEKLDTKIDQVNEQLVDLRTDFKIHVALIEEHINGDRQIVNEIQPMIDAYKFEKYKKIEEADKREKLYTVLKIVSSVSGLALVSYQIFAYLQK